MMLCKARFEEKKRNSLLVDPKKIRVSFSKEGVRPTATSWCFGPVAKADWDIPKPLPETRPETPKTPAPPQAETQAESTDFSDEIVVCIGRKGEFILEKGLERLISAQERNLEKVPVIVGLRHEEWAKMRRDVIRIVAERGFLHQPFNNPDIDGVSQHYGNHMRDTAMYGNERWDFISQNLPFSSGTALDIGAYFGYFCHRLEDLGFECFAVEMDRPNLRVLNRYRRIMGRRFTVWEKSIFEIERSEYDLVIALNVFHHLVRTMKGHDALIRFLQGLKCKAMFFETGKNIADAYKRFSDDEFIDFIFQHSVLKCSKKIGRAKEGRDVYLLTA